MSYFAVNVNTVSMLDFERNATSFIHETLHLNKTFFLVINHEKHCHLEHFLLSFCESTVTQRYSFNHHLRWTGLVVIK